MTLAQLHRDTPFDRFEVCLAYQALEYDWNRGGAVIERPRWSRCRESIGVQLSRIKFRSPPSYGGFHSLLPDGTYDGFDDEHEAARESYVNALIAWGLALLVDPSDELGQYIRATYVSAFINQHFPQLRAAQ